MSEINPHRSLAMLVRPIILGVALFAFATTLTAADNETKPAKAAPATSEETDLAKTLSVKGQTAEVDVNLAESARISVSIEVATDANLLAICKQPMVGKLDLRDASKVSTTGFGHLKELPNLQTLLICKGDISPQEALAISNLKSLTTLSLSGCKTTDIAVGNFKRLKDLIEIDLSGTKVSERGLEPLLELKSLKVANLSETGFGDKALPKWMALEKLENIKLMATKVSRDALDKAEEELKTSKRKLKIEY
jgi:hypothetical protein